MGCYNEVIYTCPNCCGQIIDQSKSGSCEMKTYGQRFVPVTDLAGLDKQVWCHGCESSFFVQGATHVELTLVPFSVGEGE